MSAVADKAELRTAMRVRRRILAHDRPDAAARAAAHLVAADLPAPRVAATYHPMGAELDPGPLGARLGESGAALALPAVLAADAPLAFRLFADGAPLTRDASGAPAPAADALEVTPDLVLVPLLAFDRTGARLGQGGGWYDRTLRALRGRGTVFALGLAYAGQEVDALPTEAHDQRLDAVLTEAGLVRFDL